METDQKVASRRRQLALAAFLVICAAAVVLMLSGGDGEQPSVPTGEPARSSASPRAKETFTRVPAVVPNTVTLPRGGRARLVRTEVGDDGTLPIPSRLGEAAWWGAHVGANGAMLLSGHVNWKGEIGPFDELWKSQRNDVVTIVGAPGQKFAYRVSEVITLDKEALPARAEELFGQRGPHRLVLVTCGGRFVGGGQGYEDNRIVVALPTRSS